MVPENGTDYERIPIFRCSRDLKCKNIQLYTVVYNLSIYVHIYNNLKRVPNLNSNKCITKTILHAKHVYELTKCELF